MPEQNYLSLQPSEGIIANMASRIFAAYVQKGEVNDHNAEQFILKSTQLALRIAHHTDKISLSDAEWMGEKGAGSTGLL